MISKLTVLDTSYPWAIDTDTQIGDSIYTDRDGVTYSVLPDWLIGGEAIVSPCDAKKIEGDLANLTAAEDITLVVQSIRESQQRPHGFPTGMLQVKPQKAIRMLYIPCTAKISHQVRLLHLAQMVRLQVVLDILYLL